MPKLFKNNTFPLNFALFFFISIWLTLDTTFYDLNLPTALNFKETILFARSVLPYLLLPIYFNIFGSKIFSKTENKFFNIFISLIIINFTLQFFSLFFSENSLVHSNYIFLKIFCISIFIIFYNINSSDKVFDISIGMLGIIMFIYGGVLLKWFFTDTADLNLYGSWPQNLFELSNLSNNVPRSSGMARSSMLLLIPSFFSLIISPKKSNIFVIIFFSFIVLLTQSRIVTLFYFLLIFFIIIKYIVFDKRSNKKKIEIFLYIILVPFLITTVAVKSKNLITEKFVIDEKKIEKFETTLRNAEVIRKIDPATFTSHRVVDWMKIAKKNEKIIFGNGVMGDRFLINQSASNIYLYSYASGGLISLFLILTIVLRSLWINFNILFKTKVKLTKKNFRTISACFIQFFLIGRSLVETSFGIFGIDFLIFFTCYFLSERFYKNEKKV